MVSNFATKIYLLLLQIETWHRFLSFIWQECQQHLKVNSREGVAPSCTPGVAAGGKKAFELPRPIRYLEAYLESTHRRRITLTT